MILTKKSLVSSYPRRRVSRLLIFLDSGLRRNDEKALQQTFVGLIIGITLFIVAGVISASAAVSQETIPRSAPAKHSSAESKPFSLVHNGKAVKIFYDSDDAAVVSIAAHAFAHDVKQVSGAMPAVVTSKPTGATAIIVGTLGKSSLIDSLRSNDRLNTHAIVGQREAYQLTTLIKPFAGVQRALVVTGADRRGTAYGIFKLSRMIGVSPWVWWADVAPAHQDNPVLPGKTIAYGSPSVRYRGIFINDEDWSLRPWAAKTLDPKTGNIGPKTYKHVFELLLRLRANFLWPAMHQGTVAFNQVAANAKLANRYAIVMGSSHAEPMLRTNVAEWNPRVRGPFDYATNGSNVLKYWSERVQTNGRFENVYDMGMRGMHDSPMIAGRGVNKVKLLEKIVHDQRSLFCKDLGRDPATVPQLFVPYKEVLALFRRGLELPSDITLGWVDDNFGYIRQLSGKAQQARSGGAGVYYHISYWGAPADYLWLNTTPPSLIAEEMSKAYHTNARRAWVLNVGDIKPGEIGAEYFLDLAYDFDATSALSQRGWLKRWASETFGSEHAKAIADILTQYYHLGFQRKPEHMGWNEDGRGVHPASISPVAYGDAAARRLRAYRRLDKRASAVAKVLGHAEQGAFYQLVLYPIRGSRLMNEKMLDADRSYLYAYQGRASANSYALQAAKAYQAIHRETAHYNEIGDGKWRDFMDDAPRKLAVFQSPPVGHVTPSAHASLGVAVEGSIEAWAKHPARADADYSIKVRKWRTSGAKRDTLPEFEHATDRRHFIDVFNTGTGKFNFKVRSSAPWIKVDHTRGTIKTDTRLWVSIDWSQLAPKQTERAFITVTGAGASHRVNVKARDMRAPSGLLVEDNGIVAAPAGHYTSNVKVKGKGWRRVAGLGRSGEALKTGALAQSYTTPSKAPYVEYKFRASSTGSAAVRVNLLPTFPLNSDHKLRYAISLDGAPAKIVDVEAHKSWDQAVEANATTSISHWTLARAGEHRLRVYALDPGLVLDSLVINFGGLKASYLVPPETIAK